MCISSTVWWGSPEALEQWQHPPCNAIVLCRPVVEEVPLQEREGAGNHASDLCVEVAAAGHSLLCHTQGEPRDLYSLQQGL